MNNLIQSGVEAKTTKGMAGRLKNQYSVRLDPLLKNFAFRVSEPSTDPARLLSEQHAFAVAANAIREEEKTRLARELHDELAQSLAALKMDTLWVRDHAAGGLETVGAKLDDMVALLDQTVAATRRMASDLRPLLLDDLGLRAAIEWLIGSFTQRCGIPCRLLVCDWLELEVQEPHATAIFRIIQESLANVAKHAGASQVEISFRRVGRSMILITQDDGCGFLADEVRSPQSLGLTGLHERAQLLNGLVVITSAPGKGTRVEVTIPCQQIRAVS